MIAWFALGALALVGLLLLLRSLASADPALLARWLRIGGAVLLAGAAGLLIFSGRIGTAMMLGSLLLPFFVRWRQLHRRVRAAAGPARGQSSTVETRFVEMTLDHDTGEVSGVVRSGAFAGRPLASLSFAEAVALWQEAAADADSARVIEGWLERSHGDDWRERAGTGAGDAGPATGPMTEAEALHILGLEPGADEAEIRAAHRRLMMANHPDRGGSTWVAAKINEAKDLLLGRRG